MIDWSVFTIGNLSATLVAGLLAGGYLTAFHPATITVPLARRSLLTAWYFGFLGSVLYVARLVNGLATGSVDTPRVVSGWALWIAFSVFIAGGAYLGGWLRARARARKVDAAAYDAPAEEGKR